jgi:hypothetical protein
MRSSPPIGQCQIEFDSRFNVVGGFKRDLKRKVVSDKEAK